MFCSPCHMHSHPSQRLQPHDKVNITPTEFTHPQHAPSRYAANKVSVWDMQHVLNPNFIFCISICVTSRMLVHLLHNICVRQICNANFIRVISVCGMSQICHKIPVAESSINRFCKCNTSSFNVLISTKLPGVLNANLNPSKHGFKSIKLTDMATGTIGKHTKCLCTHGQV